MNRIFKRAALITNLERDESEKCSEKIKEKLKSHGCKVVCHYLNDPPFSHDADIYIVVGGDGSMLRAARDASPNGIPIIGVNKGHLGYMTELEEDEISLIDKLFEGGYSIDERMMISAEVIRDGEVVYGKSSALNDIVISNGALSRMVDLELSCNGALVGHYRADGLICSTPTGSTAYSLSAGGPVIDPTLDCVCVTTVSPHSLRVRPLIFSPESVLEIRRRRNTGGELYLTVDGSENFHLESEDMVRVTKSKMTTKLIRIKEYGFFDILANKMSE